MYPATTLIVAAIVACSGIMTVRCNPHIVRKLNNDVGIPLSYFPLLAACEFAGALGLVLGIFWPLLGVLAGIGLALYFVGAILSHIRVYDFKGIGPALFMLIVVTAALAMRLHRGPHPHWYRL